MRRYYENHKIIRRQKIVSNVALVLIIGALGIVLYRVVGLVNQLKGEIKIDNLYSIATPVKGYETAQPLSEEIMAELPSSADENTVLPQFTSLYNENSDTVGWLKLSNTQINHVVVQGENNVYYLEHDFFGNKSSSATMMLDMRCDIENLKYHYVIYGHRMKSGTMMNDILKYEDKEFFIANPKFQFDTIYQTLEWEVFSTYCTDYNYDNTEIVFANDVEWLEYIQRLQRKSIYQNDVELSIDDVVLTLYTCDYRIAGGRYVVHARLIRD